MKCSLISQKFMSLGFVCDCQNKPHDTFTHSLQIHYYKHLLTIQDIFLSVPTIMAMRVRTQLCFMMQTNMDTMAVLFCSFSFLGGSATASSSVSSSSRDVDALGVPSALMGSIVLQPVFSASSTRSYKRTLPLLVQN